MEMRVTFSLLLTSISNTLTEDSMAQPVQLDDLAAKHQALERLIAEEQEQLGSSDLRLAELKRKKLKLKDEIAEIEATRH
jgi:hypothetical protein